MIIDINGIQLIPGNCGRECPGSWELAGLNCCCDECDYMLCCLESHDTEDCRSCTDPDCPRASGSNDELPEILQKMKNNA